MPETAKKAAAKDATVAGERAARSRAAEDLNAARNAVGDALDSYRANGAEDTDLTPVWKHLARPFATEDQEKLPKPLKGRDDNRGRCEDTGSGRYYSADGHYCGGWHARSVHLDYIGHAGITMRLNDTVGPENWTLEPLAWSPDNLPLMRSGEFWVRLTVLGVSKIDVAADYKGVQEALGDGLRRAAMRFGIGTYLWSKSEAALALKQATDDAPPPPGQATAPAPRRQEAPPVQPNQPAAQADGPPPPYVQILLDRVAALDDASRQALDTWWRAATWDNAPLPSAKRLTSDQVNWVLENGVAPLEDPWGSQQQSADDPWVNTEPGTHGDPAPH